MDVTLFGIVTEVKLMQLLNAPLLKPPSLIIVKLSGRVTEAKLEHPAKAPKPRVVTPCPICAAVIVVIFFALTQLSGIASNTNPVTASEAPTNKVGVRSSEN